MAIATRRAIDLKQIAVVDRREATSSLQSAGRLLMRVKKSVPVRPFFYIGDPSEKIFDAVRFRICALEPALGSHEPVAETPAPDLDRWINLH